MRAKQPKMMTKILEMLIEREETALAC